MKKLFILFAFALWLLAGCSSNKATSNENADGQTTKEWHTYSCFSLKAFGVTPNFDLNTVEK